MQALEQLGKIDYTKSLSSQKKVMEKKSVERGETDLAYYGDIERQQSSLYGQ